VTLRAAGELDDQAVSCHVSTGKALVEAGLHPASGGGGMLACSGDMLLEALVACAGVTLRAVATSMGLDVRGGTEHAVGDLDFRGTLGVDLAGTALMPTIRLWAGSGDHAPTLAWEASVEAQPPLPRSPEGRYCQIGCGRDGLHRRRRIVN